MVTYGINKVINNNIWDSCGEELEIGSLISYIVGWISTLGIELHVRMKFSFQNSIYLNSMHYINLSLNAT
jgi:hypothetical protein